MSPRRDRAQRAFDIAVAAVVLALSLPAWPLIAIAIKVESSGPVLFRGRRLGRGGAEFAIMKFRSMTSGPGRAITVGGDARVTKVGRVLRKAKLDELPQLVNVLRGDMSIVGWRPEAPDYLDAYPDDLRAIFDFRPGITGPASIAYRHEEEVLAAAADPDRFYVEELLPEKVRLDLDYCRTATVWSDVKTVVRTLTSVADVRGGSR